MKLKLLFSLMLFASFGAFSQNFAVHDVDNCKLLDAYAVSNATLNQSVTNPDATDAVANPNVSQIVPSDLNPTVLFNLPYQIQTGDDVTINYSLRFYSANTGSAGNGQGRIVLRIFNRSLGPGPNVRSDIKITNKTGGWQTITGTATLNPSDSEGVNENGGYNALVLSASNLAGEDVNLEPLFFDDFEFSVNPILSDVTSDLLANNSWIFNFSPDEINKTYEQSFVVVDEAFGTPSSEGNDSATVMKITRGNAANPYLKFAIDPIDKTAGGTIKYRIYPECKLGVAMNTRLMLRKDNLGATQQVSQTLSLIPNIWNEVEIDIAALAGAEITADNLYNDMLIFFNFGDATPEAVNTIFYLDALQSPAYAATFDGETDSDWGTATNWSNDVLPNSLHNISIPSGKNVTIGATTGATANNLTVDGAGSLTVTSGGSLIANGTATGNVTYNRNLNFVSGNDKGWHLVGSPVASETYDNAYATANSLATSGNKRGLATYNTALDTWTYLENDDSNAGTFTSGLGYSLKRASTGTVSFTGTINTADVTPGVLATGNGFNLVSNPYTSYINSGTFLTENTANLVSETIWLWDPVNENYQTKVTNDAYTLSPGQGFFVRASGGSVNFIESNQLSGTDNFQKSGSTRPEVNLMITDGALNRFAKLYYLGNATKGFDNGYDGETFGGIANSLDVFTHLVSDSEGKNFQIQSLPNADYENMVVPVGVKTVAGKEIIFTAEAMNLPNGIKVYLEDRLTNTFTDLSDNNSYKVNLDDSINGVGRFYVHTKSGAALSTDDVLSENISVYKTNNSTVRIVGLSSGKSNLKLFNILGKLVMNTSFISDGVKDITLPNLAKGVYIVQLENDSSKLNKKIILE
jgi:hypothetical protein